MDFEDLLPRQIVPTRLIPTSEPPPTKTKAVHGCTPFNLPSGGHFVINPTSTITLLSNVVFTPGCQPTDGASVAVSASGFAGIQDVKDPFHASVTPQVYATAAATVIAWMLVIMLMITPRTYFIGGAAGGFGVLNRHGMISGAQGGASVIGVGSRPWLQKVAALTVAVSLTIATADTFEVAERQYASGYMNAEKLRAEVVGSTEIKVTRVVSDIFIWLAQVQTLIRLFPRHKEKVLIKWIGFALIILDATFSCLNSFMGNPVGRPKRFRDAIPALSYLFQLALSMLYAAWVIYYAICKRRYAFYHKEMWNVTLVALLSMVAIMTPVVFFITDISNQSVAGWGDYFRWVGAAAASVIVWEWVERIEALEREEKKDGILGREVFDGDEMLGNSETEEVIWPRRRRFWGGRPGWRRSGNHGGGGDGSGGTGGAFASGQDMDKSEVPSHHVHFRSAEKALAIARSRARQVTGRLPKENDPTHLGPPISTPPPVAVSPVSRADTASAASTIYTVRYHTLVTPTPPTVRQSQNLTARQSQINSARHSQIASARQSQIASARQSHIASARQSRIASDRQSQTLTAFNNRLSANLPKEDPDAEPAPPGTEKIVVFGQDDTEQSRRKDSSASQRLNSLNPFKRRRVLPPEEVRAGQVIDPVSLPSAQPSHSYESWDLKSRLGAFAADQGEKWRENKRRRGDGREKDLPVTIIPAQPRGRTWSPATAVGEASGPTPTRRLTRDDANTIQICVSAEPERDAQPTSAAQASFNESGPTLVGTPQLGLAGSSQFASVSQFESLTAITRAADDWTPLDFDENARHRPVSAGREVVEPGRDSPDVRRRSALRRSASQPLDASR